MVPEANGNGRREPVTESDNISPRTAEVLDKMKTEITLVQAESDLVEMKERLSEATDALWEIHDAMDSLRYAAPEMRPLHEARIHRAVQIGLGMVDAE